MNHPILQNYKTINQINTTNKKVLLRVDLNVPLHNGIIIDDYRLQAILPTLALLQKNNTHIILATHIGRPTNKNPELSTQHLMPWFKQHGFTITYAATIEQAKQLLENSSANTLILLENLRFFAGEKNHDANFAQQLAALADCYVNDAFALLHRNDTSITLVPKLFDQNHKAIGPLIIQELNALNKLLNNPKKPFVLIIGGGKVETKLPLINNLLDLVDTVLLCPAVVNTFLYAQGKPVGKSLVIPELTTTAQEIIQRAKQKKVTLYFPLDYQVALDTLKRDLIEMDNDYFPANALAIAIGSKTITQWAPLITQAHTLFFNGSMGFADRPDTLKSLYALLHLIAQSDAYTVIGGGDSVAAVNKLGIANNISYLSTGGGATITYLSGQPLIGLLTMN